MNKQKKDQIDGKLKVFKGSFKKGMGKLLGNRDLEAEGSADKMEGKFQAGVAKVEGAVNTGVAKAGAVVDRLGDKIKKY